MSHLVARHLSDLHLAREKHFSPWKASKQHPKAAIASEQAKIPDPNLFASLTRSAQDANDLPTVGECAVHLELLEAFRVLRLNVIRSTDLDTTFGVEIKKRTVFRRGWDDKKGKYAMMPGHLKDLTWETRRREKWPDFLGIAASRFRVWIIKMEAYLKAMDAAGTPKTRLPYLPPLDVLMVWHAFLLNPHDYDEACRRDNLTRIYELGFPWQDVHAALDRKNWKYTLPTPSGDWAREYANMEPDLYYFLSGGSKMPNKMSAVLARYGAVEPGRPIFSRDEVLDTEGLNSHDKAFLIMLQQIVLDTNAIAPLVGNVYRQASFVDKMHAQLWIRSPAVEGTLRRAGDRYDKFLRLFHLYPGRMLVPTLDIDIVWHTHQCSAAGYRYSVKARTGVFINHDDKVGQSVLKGGLQVTKERFLLRFGEDYEKCLCWECEAIASALEEYDAGGGPGNLDILSEKVRETVEYHRAVETCRQRG